MLLKIDETNRIAERVVVRAMFEARKRVFIDLLKWDLPAYAGKYEIDRFDDGLARYLILKDAAGAHLASARLLLTTRPGILGTLFSDLCDEGPPVGEAIWEITRFCLSTDMPASQRRRCRNELISALALYAIEHGIECYTGVAELPWLRQILDLGWDCAMLGEPRRYDARQLGALKIRITQNTVKGLQDTGVFALPGAAAASLPVA